MLPNDEVPNVDAGIAEVGVVEQGERLEAELELQPLMDREVLEQREIHGLRAGAMQQVAALVPIGEVGRHGGIQIRNRVGGGVDAAHQVPAPAVVARRVEQVRPVGAAGAGVGRVGSGRNVEWNAGLQRHDAVALPPGERALQERVRDREEGNIVNEGGHETVADVPVGVAVVGLPQIRLQRSAAAVGIRGDIQRVRPGVVGVHGQAARQALVEDHGHALVIGDLVGVDGADDAK